MKTSYFGNISEVTSPISISYSPPRWYNGNAYPWLAPTREILADYKAGLLTVKQYAERFEVDILSKLNPVNVHLALLKIGGMDATLLCFEKPGEFCHRRLVAEWLEHHRGLHIPEQPTEFWQPGTKTDLLAF
jgi:hypothetical protein